MTEAEHPDAVKAAVDKTNKTLTITVSYLDNRDLDEVGMLSGLLAGYKNVCYREQVEPVSFFLTEFEKEYGELLALDEGDAEEGH